jgi:hypothetical protein
MKTLFRRLGIVLPLMALLAGAVFAQEEGAATVNSFTFVLVIIGGGIAVVAALGFLMRENNGNNDNKSE